MDRRVGREQAAFLAAVEQEQELLRLAEGEHRDQHRPAPLERPAHDRGEALGLGRPGVVLGAGRRAAGGFHHQHVEAGIAGEIGRPAEVLVLELDVAGVEKRAAAGADQHSGAPGDVARIEELDRGTAAQVQLAAEAQRAHAGHARLDFAVGEQRVVRDAQFLPLAAHDVDRVVQHGVAQRGRHFREHDLRPGEEAVHHGQRPQMVVVGMGDEDGVEVSVDDPQLGQGLPAFQLRVHARVDQEASPACHQMVAVGPDFVEAGQVGEAHGRKGDVVWGAPSG